mmetsp:Transcript_14294/g.23331  ORF Transcript_14294/g.23331 Transcript_14294/m.23331 type:complete len:91 (-) Transcript_14294:84-356(-)
MHPPLLRPHPMCQDVIEALTKCHEDHPYMKYLGKCNMCKVELDQCFRIEKEVTRKANMKKGKDIQDRWNAKREERRKEMEEARKAAPNNS